jgi:LAS superfamily LD-carboxypeptidase LdcB
MNEFELTGRAQTHVRQFAPQRGQAAAGLPLTPRFAAQPQVAEAFLAMRAAALADGIDMLPCASFRPLAGQLRIWNRKFSGEATLRDIDGRPRAFASLSPQEVVWAILGWSGLPGATRRHWGTDIDVFDRAAQPPGYKVKLLPEEVAPGGVYVRLHAWLDEHIARFGFFRPYRSYRGGMYPEPWHLSHISSAQAALSAFDIDMVARTLRGADMLGRDLVLDMLPEIFNKHVMNVDAPDISLVP